MGVKILLRTGMRFVRSQFQKLQLKFLPNAIILNYHRVADLPSDPQLLSVSPANFEEQIEYIANNFNPVSLRELFDIKQAKDEIPKGTIGVTFDDGYADNLWSAKPILEKYSVPATVYIITGYINTEREFWWDNLERLILVPEKIPYALILKIDNKLYSWDNLDGQQSVKTKNSQRERVLTSDTINKKWDITQQYFPEPKYQLYSDLYRLLRPLKSEERQSVIKQIESWSGITDSKRHEYRILNRDEICELNRGGLIDIGSHTITHSVLKYESIQNQKKEIIGSKQTLEDILDHEVTLFSYPFGSRGDFSRYTVNLVKNAGYKLACANYCGPVTPWTDFYRLPRYLVRNWNKGEFAQAVTEWYYGTSFLKNS